MAELLMGAPVAKALTAKLPARIKKLFAAGITPTLAILRVGANPEDLRYEQRATARCAELGIRVRSICLPEDCRQEELQKAIKAINRDEGVHGCLMMRPLPKHLDEWKACVAISPDKDVDGVGAASLSGVFLGRRLGYPPCTAQACLAILDHYGIDPRGKKAVVIGRSPVAGKPISMLLLNRDATVTICHKGTRKLSDVCREADILAVAVGKAGIVDARFVRPGQIVLDVGINPCPEGICGDVVFDEVAPLVQAITPVPGGIGSVTTAVLCEHAVEAAERALDRARQRLRRSEGF